MTGPSRQLKAGVLALVVAAALAAGARDPDNPDKPSRADKLERRRERALAAASAAATATPTVTPAPAARSASVPAPSGAPTFPSVALTSDAKFNQFRLILERNIFNPARVARVPATAEEKPVRVDTIAFVGTLDNGNGSLAFFDSSDPSLRKAVHEGDGVGEFKVQRITRSEVDLVHDGKPVALQVGQQLRRTENGPWTVAAVDPAADASASATTPTAAATTSSPAPTLPPGASDALRRLIEQRQKQLKQ